MITRQEKRKILKAFTRIVESNNNFDIYQKQNLLIDLQGVLVFTQNYSFIDFQSIERLLNYKIERGLI